jgi:hypothetical protein
MELQGVALSAGEIGLSLVLGISAATKFLEAPQWHRALANYRMPLVNATPVRATVPFAELLVAAAVAMDLRAGLLAGFFLFSGFALVLALAIARGAVGDCGCFGGILEPAIGPWALVRALALALVALLLFSAFPGQSALGAGQPLIVASLGILLLLANRMHAVLTTPSVGREYE